MAGVVRGYEIAACLIGAAVLAVLYLGFAVGLIYNIAIGR